MLNAHNRIAGKLAEKGNISSSKLKVWVRTKLNFSLPGQPRLALGHEIRGKRKSKIYVRMTLVDTGLENIFE